MNKGYIIKNNTCFDPRLSFLENETMTSAFAVRLIVSILSLGVEMCSRY